MKNSLVVSSLFDLPRTPHANRFKIEICTMLIAGHETTSTTVTWLVYELAQPHKRHIQDTLRAELLSVSSNRPSMEELNALPYLDAVVRENLRLNNALDITVRCAGKDDYIPVSTPFVDKSGVERTEIRCECYRTCIRLATSVLTTYSITGLHPGSRSLFPFPSLIVTKRFGEMMLMNSSEFIGRL